MINKKKLNWRFKGNELNYVSEVLKQGFKAGSDGAFSSLLEDKFNKTHNVKYSIAVNSGTSGLFTALLALGCKNGDEVLVPALTPLMCGLSIHYTGASPVYVDSDSETFLMCTKDLEKKITKKTKCIMVVHMYGAVCDMKKIIQLSKKYKLPIIEDCAQCFYGKDEKGRISGTIGDIGVWSFENSKQITCGDGGLVSTNNKKLAKKIRQIAGLGFKTITAKTGRIRINKDKFQNPNWTRFSEIGYNFRINQLAAAVCLAQLENFNFYIKKRINSGESYSKILKNNKFFKVQSILKNKQHTYYTFSALYLGANYGVSWKSFRKKYIYFGGDGIYAASKLLHQEPAFKKYDIGYCYKNCKNKCQLICSKTPVATHLQKNLMNFTTNQKNKNEISKQADALIKTLDFFKKY